jgi:hypothetical protein
MFEYMIISLLVISFLFSFCGLIQKLKMHYRSENATSTSTQSVPNQTTIAVIEGDKFPQEYYPCAPPEYTEIDLPPKYADISKHEIIYPTVHGYNNQNNEVITIIST